MRFLGGSAPGSEVTSGLIPGSEVTGCFFPGVSPDGSDGLESLDSDGSEAGALGESEVRSLEGSEVIFFRQDA